MQSPVHTTSVECRRTRSTVNRTARTILVYLAAIFMVVIAFQVIFCTSYGLNWFPVQGWVEPPPNYPDATTGEIYYYYWY